MQAGKYNKQGIVVPWKSGEDIFKKKEWSTVFWAVAEN